MRFMTLLSLWLPVILWCSLLFYLSSVPNLTISPDTFWDFIYRKLAHFGVYAVLYFLAFRALGLARYALIFSLAYALSDELHQHFVPTRSGNPRDLVIDFAGILTSLFVTQNIYHHKGDVQ